VKGISHLLNAAVLAALAVQAVAQGGSGLAVSGIVVDSRSHSPLAHMRVVLSPTAAGLSAEQEMLSAADGSFSFRATAGKYHLAAGRAGYPLRAYRQSALSSGSSALAVRDGEDTTHLVFEAEKGAVISGAVLDEDSDPVGEALVSLFVSSITDGEPRTQRFRQVFANAAGEFRFAGLPKGSYYLCAMGRPWFATSTLALNWRNSAVSLQARGTPESQPSRAPAPPYLPDPLTRGTAFVPTFYPGVTSADRATAIRLDVGAEVPVTITLPLTTAVSVKGTAGAPGDGTVYLNKRFASGTVSYTDGTIAPDGRFSLTNVPPGSYEIKASSRVNSGEASWNSRDEIEVGATDLEVTLRPDPFASISGKLRFAGEPPTAKSQPLVGVREETSGAQHMVVPADGYSIERLPAGRYSTVASMPGYLLAYLISPSGERLPREFSIAPGESLKRDLMFVKALGEIDGVAALDGAPQAGALILLLPADAGERWAVRYDQSDSDGSFRLPTIPAGDYRLIALSQGEGIAYRNPKVAAALARSAQPVQVTSTSRLHIKVAIVDPATLNLPAL
jgi:hypothetical protein